MIYKLVIPLSIVATLLFCLTSKAESQNFYKAYKSYLTSNLRNKNARKNAKFIVATITRLQAAVDSNEKINKRSFFTVDTVYVVSFIGAETGFSSAIIWNKKTSCYYRYSYEMLHFKKIRERLEIKADASELLKFLHKDFRRIVQTGDTVGYHAYADKHKVYDGEWVTPLIAIKINNLWQFTTFNGNGWAVNVNSTNN